MSKPQSVTPGQLLVIIALFGLGFWRAIHSRAGLESTAFAETPTALSQTLRYYLPITVLSFLGRFVLLRARDDDIGYYRANSSDDAETRARLERRYRQIGNTSRFFGAVGLCSAVIMVVRLIFQGTT